jgi:NADH-quinone oxidoreductase subunit M
MDDKICILLPILLAVPLFGAMVGAFISHGGHARHWALLISLVTFAVSVAIGVEFYRAGGALIFRPESYQIHDLGFGFSLRVDAISLWLVILTTFLTPLAILFSFGSITERETEYYGWMNALLLTMLGVFVSADLLLFYVFFELTLVPMFFIIGIWGGTQRRFASTKFFLFTFGGSVFTLGASIYVGAQAGTFDIASVVSFAQAHLSSSERWWVALGLLAGFAVKTPLFPVHTWLPLAHTEAPTAGSVILAGVLLKLGTYGLLRLAVPIGMLTSTGVAFPHFVHVVGVICIIGVIYAALVAWVQPDIKKLVAYSSVSHLGFCILGLFALNDIGIQGSVLYMINHGLSTGAMFLVIGMIYDRYHTRDINELSGLAKRMPILAFFFVFFVLSSIGLPGLNGFWSEFLTILGAFTSEHLGPVYGSVAALGIILGAVYMLHMTARVIWGPLKVPVVAGHGHGQADQGQAATPDHAGHSRHDNNLGDIGFREISVLIPIAIAVIVLGVKPGLVIDRMIGPVQQIRSPLIESGAETTMKKTTGPKQVIAKSSVEAAT